MDRRTGGFTLIEAMVVLLIMAIVLAFGVPAFGDLIDKTRVRTAVEATIEAFRIARLTAVQERKSVKMCAWSDSDACSGSNWKDGIMIVKAGKKSEVSGVPDEPDELIYRMRFDEKLYVRKNNIEGETDEVNINASGWTPGDQASIFICASEEDTKHGQRIYISGAGKIRFVPITDCTAS